MGQCSIINKMCKSSPLKLEERCNRGIRKNVRGKARMKGCEMLVSEQDGAIEIMNSQVLWMLTQGMGKTVGS